MKLEPNKKYLLVKDSENKRYPCVVNPDKTLQIMGLVGLDIMETKTFKAAWYDENTDRIFGRSLNHLTSWRLVEYSEPVKTCDCGGYITFKNYSPEFHSGWCSVNKG